MSGGAGSAGGSGGMGQQPMGNAGAQPGGGGFGPGVTNFGGGSPFGMQQQQPYGMQPMQNPFGGQQLGPDQIPGYGMNQFQQQQQMQNPNGPSQPTPMQMPQPGSQTPAWAGGYLSQQQQQPQQPSYMNNPDFQAYQKQEQDLGRQLQEYTQKSPLYQQLQDLNGKMRGFQQPQQGQMQNPYGNIDQMQQQRNMQDQARQQRMYQQATQDDMRAAVMPNQSGYQGQMGDTGFRAMPAVMPQQPDPRMRDALTLYTPETYGRRGQQPGPESVAPEFGNYGRIDNRMGMPDYGRGGYGGGRGAFGGRMGGGFGGRGGYGRQMPQQDYGYGQMQNQMQQQAQFGQQQRQQYGGLDALQQYLQPPSYRPPVVAPQPLNPGLTAPPPPPPPSGSDGGYTPPAPF